ncbi:MAG: hypothetical protein NZ903_00445 [Candidatus Micrarchaeota archaeon]|nr:hypothetical protein [Candidatus Micrarchaeota archaeon]
MKDKFKFSCNRNFHAGQVAFEFLLIYSFFIFVFLSSLYIISGQAIQQQRYAEEMYAREFIITISDEINAAAMFHGYEKVISIPKTINSVPYQIYFYKGMIGLNYSSIVDIDILYPLATDNIIVNNRDSRERVAYIDTSKGSFTIINIDGQVIIYD